MNDENSDIGSGASEIQEVNQPPPNLEAAARASIELAKGFWEKSSALMWITDGAGRLHHFDQLNPGARSPAGAPEPIPTGSAQIQMVRHVNCHDRAVFEGGHSVQSLESLPSLDGMLHHYLVIRFPFADCNGTRYLTGVAISITQHMIQLNELTHMAMFDELTGLYNRHGFILFAEHELKSARRRKTHSAIIYVAIDGLKRINDTYGHDEGNSFILETAAILRREFREGDVIGRIGSDEFSIFASDVKETPENLKSRLTAQLVNSSLRMGRLAPLSVSIGIADCRHDERATLTALLATADHALYKDKCSNGDRVTASLNFRKSSPGLRGFFGQFTDSLRR